MLENVDFSLNVLEVLSEKQYFGFFSFKIKIDDSMILKERMCHMIVHIHLNSVLKKR